MVRLMAADCFPADAQSLKKEMRDLLINLFS
jgi:hypothetical protein